MTIITCKSCKKKFSFSYKKKPIFCNKNCYFTWRKKHWPKGNIPWTKGTTTTSLICKICNKSFDVPICRKNKAKYCSRKCEVKSRKKEQTKSIICILCGKKFYVKMGRKNAKFCSRQCHYEYRIKSGSYKGKNNSRWKEKILKKCKYCSNEFIVSFCRKNSANFCSHKCHSKYIKGKNAPLWQGGISRLPYSFDFDEELKELIRKRDNYKCQICSCPQEENIVKLPVHHIDYDKQNSNPNNLISLCLNCHSKTNHNREYWKQELLDTLKKRGCFNYV